MTMEEFKALDEDVQEEYLEENRDAKEYWEKKIKPVIDLPYPENLLTCMYHGHVTILKPVDDLLDERATQLKPEYQHIFEHVFKNHGDVEPLAEEYQRMYFFMVGMIMKVPRMFGYQKIRIRNEKRVSIVYDAFDEE